MRKAFTGKGDDGWTRDFSGKKLRKDHPSIVAAGKIDSLQCVLDIVISRNKGNAKRILERVQKKLWQLQGEVSCGPATCVNDPIIQKDVVLLEKFINKLGSPPQKFVRFRTLQSIIFNECRVRCREVERSLVKLLFSKKIRQVSFKYVNRLSSLLYILAVKK